MVGPIAIGSLFQDIEIIEIIAIFCQILKLLKLLKYFNIWPNVAIIEIFEYLAKY